jgi:hypothetical protein
MPEGGAWFTGVTKMKLDQNSNAPSNTYFIGAQISVTSKYVYQYTAETATYVPPPPSNSGGPGCCFDPEAKVSMSDGTFKRIADVLIGDTVLNQHGGINTVLGIEAPELGKRLMYKFNDRWAFVSEEHPILTTNGWAAFDPTSWAVEEEFIGKLNKIEIGTTIITPNGTEVVNSIESVEMPEDYVIYNLMLDGDHTYVVEGVVVHNKKIICTKLYHLGLMDEEIYKADQAFGEVLRETDPDAYYGYIRWAQVVVDWMSGQGPQCMFWIRDDKKRAETQQRLAIKWAHRIATPWAEHMAYLMGQRDKDNFAGKIIMNIGKPISKLVNLFPKSKKEPGLATGYSMWAVFGFLYVISKVFGNKLFPKTINN